MWTVVDGQMVFIPSPVKRQRFALGELGSQEDVLTFIGRQEARANWRPLTGKGAE